MHYSATSNRTTLLRRCTSQTGAVVQPRPQPMTANTDCGPFGHAATRSPSLWYNGVNPCKSWNPWLWLHGLLLIYASRGMKGWVGHVCWPIHSNQWFISYIHDIYNKIQSIKIKKYTSLNKIGKYYDRPTFSAVVSMTNSSVCDDD